VIHIDIKKKLLSSEGVMTLEVNTDIQAGALTALFGPSGVGKTTLLRIIAGLTKPDSGIIRCGDQVWFDSERGIDISTQTRHIGMMFQDYALFPNMTVEQNIRFAQDHENRISIQSLMEMLQIAEFAKRRSENLSGGQKQRVALARAIARRPSLLLLDEPLSALDTTMRIMLQDEILKVHRLFGSTTILVSHDRDEVIRLAEHVLCIERGVVTVEGNPQNILSEQSAKERHQIAGQISLIEKQEGGYIVTVKTGDNIQAKVVVGENDIRELSVGDHVRVLSKAI
jgi:molybdate transport system ATP-binding protein